MTNESNDTENESPASTPENEEIEEEDKKQEQEDSKENHGALDENSQKVYVTPTGKRYHLDPDCGGKNSSETSLENALARGLTPCKKCAQ